MFDYPGGVEVIIDTRLNKILSVVNERGSITVQELMELTGSSESTVRRDLANLDKRGLLNKVHGGAVALQENIMTKDDEVILRQNMNRDEKVIIAKNAAVLIKPEDFIFLDAGTTTEIMADYISEKNVTVVTNGISHAKKLAARGIKVYLLGGMLKASTEAIVGEEAIKSLMKYNFTKGFFGTNGVSEKEGLTTPEVSEALLKEAAISKTKEVFILADSSKFGGISSTKFGDFNSGTIITTENVADKYKKYKNVTVKGA